LRYLLLLLWWLVWLLLPLVGLLLPLVGCHCSIQISLSSGKELLSQRNLGPDNVVIVLLWYPS
jgi:hypothetical protein